MIKKALIILLPFLLIFLYGFFLLLRVQYQLPVVEVADSFTRQIITGHPSAKRRSVAYAVAKIEFEGREHTVTVHDNTWEPLKAGDCVVVTRGLSGRLVEYRTTNACRLMMFSAVMGPVCMLGFWLITKRNNGGSKYKREFGDGMEQMRIAWFCIPAYGHTNPTLALVRALTESGHEIYYFSFEMFREKIENAGAVFLPCDGYDFEMEDKENADRVGKDQAFAVELLVSSTLALDEMVTEKITEIKPALIVADSIAYWGKLAALKLGLPYISSTTTFAFNRFSAKYMKHGIGETLKMLFSMPKVNKQIRRLQEKGYPVKGILDIVQNDNDTDTIVYTSKYYQPCSETFSEHYHFIGPSIRPVSESYEKKADKTVYISMGTVNQNKDFYRNCIDVLGKSDYQVIISMGTNTDHFENLPDNIEIYKSVDQMAVLSISDAFITHCGMNSASEGLYFGVPLILFPQTPEQDAVAKRTEELGAGLRLPSIEKNDIIKTVTQIFSDRKYKIGADKISDSFKRAGGIKEAVSFIETIGS